MKFQTAVIGRLRLLKNYVRCAPSIRQCLPWLLAALVKARLLRGEKIGLLEPALYRSGRKRLSVDAGSVSEMDVFHEVMIGGNYPLENLAFEPSMVADCGANIGYFSCMARRRFPEARIFAWEPDSKNFRRLVEQPLLRDARCVLNNAAVSDHIGHVFLTGAGHGCEISGEATPATGVPCIDFPAWWREHNVPGSLLKMDIEGHETALLPSLRGSWKAPCAVFLETHAEGGKDEELLAVLRADGFRVNLLRQHSLPGDPRVFKEYFAILS